TGKGIEGNFDPGQVIRFVTDAKHRLLERFTQHALSSVNAFQPFGSDFHAVGEAAGKAGAGGLIPNRQAPLAGKGPDIGLCQACFDQRTANAVFGGGLHARSVIAAIIEVSAVRDYVEIESTSNFAQVLVEFGLAEITAVRSIRDVSRSLQLMRVNHLVPNADCLGDRSGVFQFTGGKTWADRCESDRVFAEGEMRRLRDDGAINAARKRDRHATPSREKR